MSHHQNRGLGSDLFNLAGNFLHQPQQPQQQQQQQPPPQQPQQPQQSQQSQQPSGNQYGGGGNQYNPPSSGAANQYGGGNQYDNQYSGGNQYNTPSSSGTANQYGGGGNQYGGGGNQYNAPSGANQYSGGNQYNTSASSGAANQYGGGGNQYNAPSSANQYGGTGSQYGGGGNQYGSPAQQPVTSQPPQQQQQHGGLGGLLGGFLQNTPLSGIANQFSGNLSVGGVADALAPHTGVSKEKIVAGMKEALSVGIKKTVSVVGVQDGFYLNQAIKILIPPNLQEAAGMIKNFGFGSVVDDFERSMNRSAETASSQVIDVFCDAIVKMSIDDVIGVFKGGDRAITTFFENTCRQSLYQKCFPIVTKSMDENEVGKMYHQVSDVAKKVPFLSSKFNVNIEDYTVNKGLDGLFKVLSEQEKDIRNNPEARVTDLLEEVFGHIATNVFK